MTITILIPAAGSCTRMRGCDKLLELVAGEPMLRRQARLAREVCDRVTVTLRQNDSARGNVLKGLAIAALPVPDAQEGMAASLRAGAALAPASVMILPADMPEFTTDDLHLLIAAADQYPDAILRGAAVDGTPGHPVIFPTALRAELLALTGDEGARSVLQRHKARIRLIPLPGQHALTDLDTPEAWAEWRALHGQ